MYQACYKYNQFSIPVKTYEKYLLTDTWVNKLNLDVSRYNLLLNEMKVNLHVLGPLMKEEIGTNMKNNLIVLYKCHLSDISKF